MQKKVLFFIVAVQTAVILGLLALIWNHVPSDGESILWEPILVLVALVTLLVLIVAWTQTHTSLSSAAISGSRQRGLVKWFNPTKGFGFIEQDNGQDLFVHQSEIRHSGFRYLNKDDRVEYEIGTGKKGPVAQNVVCVEAAYPDLDQTMEDQRMSRAS